MSQVQDIVIVGAGAAGLTAGIAAAESARLAGKELHIVLLDAAKRFAAKILAAGGGRCNVTHERITPDDFAGPRNLIRNVLAGFDVNATIAWFASLGVDLKCEETGKFFPVTDSARTVLDALVNRCRRLGVTIQPQSRVQEILVDLPPAAPATFTIRCEQDQWQARRVVLCTGGKSMPSTGTTGQGWQLARQRGHTVTDVHPALVPLVLAENFWHAEMSGLSHEAQLSLSVDGKRTQQRTGSLLWTHVGISGPVVLDISRHWVIAHAAARKVELHCNVLAGESFDQVEHWLTEQGKMPHRLVDNVLASRLPRRLADKLSRLCRITNDVRAGQLRRQDRRALVHTLTELSLPVTGHRGWDHAEITAGGVPLQEIDYRTMESRKCPGLYLAGEMLDVDGRVGGFNMQWAWSTGHLAGLAAAKSLLQP